MAQVAIVNNRLCNIDSIVRAVENTGASVIVPRAPDDLAAATHIVLPGVGAFPAAMANLERTGMKDAIRRELARRSVPFLGICLGMQLILEWGNEHTRTAGLGLIPGTVDRLAPADARERVPHVGWNSVETARACALFEGIPDRADFYFVHSYHAHCPDAYAVARTPYCGAFVSAVANRNVFGVQFHPEKSQRHGRRLLSNFLALDGG